jgi:hypothetical protein
MVVAVSLACHFPSSEYDPVALSAASETGVLGQNMLARQGP